MRHHIKNNGRQYQQVSARAFTLVEVLVALGIFMLLLVIILVPLNMGMTMLHLGSAKTEIQSSTQRVIDTMRGDLSKAIYVYPNDIVPTVTGTSVTAKAPYGGMAPYYKTDPCSATAADRVSNLSRIDMLLPETNDGNILSPVVPTYYIVSYYARRRDVNSSYQSIDNPDVLYRAQIPFRGDAADPTSLIDDNGAAVAPSAGNTMYPASDTLNANIYNSRYSNISSTSCGSNSATLNRSAAWLQQSSDGEPNLLPLTNQNSDPTPAPVFTLYGSHVSLMPTDIGMVTGATYKETYPGFVTPKSTFICADTNKDGIIDQVTLNVLLEKVDDMGAQPRGQDLTLPQVVNLPNVRSITNVK